MSVSLMARIVIPAVLFFLPVASFALPPLVEKIEEKTDVSMTSRQREELAGLSQKKYKGLTEALDILVKQLASILPFSEEVVRKELFSDVGTPRAELNSETGAKLEKLLGREMTKTEYELVDLAFGAWKDKEKAVTREYAGQVANLVDLPEETVQDLVSR